MNRFVLLTLTVLMVLTLQDRTFGQSHDLQYFANKWSREQRQIAASCVVSWFAGAAISITNGHIVNLVRTEALLTSIPRSGDSKLLLPAVGQVTPTEVPGRILGLMLQDRALSLAPEQFFCGKQFAVRSLTKLDKQTTTLIENTEKDSNQQPEVDNDGQ